MVMMMILVRGEHGRTWGSPGCGFYHDLRGDRTRTETRTLRCMVFSKCQTLNLNYLCVCVYARGARGRTHVCTASSSIEGEMEIFKSRNQLQSATQRKVTMLL